jgi:hypothetical protein
VLSELDLTSIFTTNLLRMHVTLFFPLRLGVKDYDNISTAIVSGNPVVTIVGDHVPRFPIKLSSSSYVEYYNEMVPILQRLVPACK